MSNHRLAGRFSALWIVGSLAASIVLAAAPLRAANYSWSASSGNWSIATNWGGTVPTINDSGFVVNGGTATVSTLGTAYNSLDIDGGSTLQMLSGNMQAGTFVQNGGALYVGNASTGNFVQSGGTVQIYQYLSGGLCIANQPGSVGNYTMTGNSLLSLGDDGGYGANVNVGYSGTGTFTQSSGTVSIYDYNGGDLTLGAAAGGVGYYSLSGNGLLSVHGDANPGNETVGASGPGTFNQSGGSNSTDGGINIGSGAIGSYTLSHGYLSASSMSIGVSSTGTFAQSGGTSSLSGSLTLGTNSGGYGSYTLSAGTLTGPHETIGNGSTAAGQFLQTGGLNNAASLTIANSGVYLLHGGTLQVVGDLTNQGLLDGGNTAAVLSVVGSSIDDFSQGTLQNCASTTVTAGPFSLMNFPAGFNPSTAFAAYSTQGLTHIVGSTLVVPAGRGFMGSITLNDPVSCQGSMIASSGNINLNNGLSMSGTAAVSLGSGNLTVNDTVSGMSGSSGLSLQSLYVGTTNNASFNQSGGTSSMVLTLTLGANPGVSGSYSLGSGASLTTGLGEVIGNSGSGSFTQTGGINTISALIVNFSLGANSGSYGSYTLSGNGQLTAQGIGVGSFEQIGPSGIGVFNQSGGTNSCYAVVLGDNSGGSGTYNFSGGMLSIAELQAGSGGGSFYFNGGTLQSTGNFTTSVPISLGGPATIDSNGNSITIASSLSGPGGLTKINNGTLTLESVNVYSGGTTVAGGLLAVTVGASLGSGPVNVSAGTLDVTQSPLTVGSLSIGNSGTLNLAIGNALTVTGTAVLGGMLNISGSTTGSVIDLMNYAGHGGSFANAPLPFGYALQYNPTQLDLVAAYSSIGVWAAAQSGSWATPANWTEGAVPSGRGAGVEINAPTSSPLVVTLDGQQTLGALVFGNSASASTGYTISAGSLGSLTLDNSGSAAAVTVANGTHWITAPVVLAAGLVVTPSAGATLAISGNVSQTGPSGVSLNGPGVLMLSGSNTYTGPTTVSAGTLELGGSGAPGNITLNASGTGAIGLSGSVNNAGTITNSGSGSGGATISGAIGPNVTGVVQSSAASPLTLSASNTWTGGGLMIQAGTVTGTGSGAFGGGTIYLGNTSGSGSATLAVNITGGSIITYANPIAVQAGSSGLLSIVDVPASAHSVVFSGPVALDNNLSVGSVFAITFSNAITEDGNPHSITASTGTIALNAITVGAGGLTLTNAGATVLSASGGIGGTGNLVLNNNTATASAITLATAAVNNAGTITNSGGGTGSVTISSAIGPNVSGLIQNSGNSLLVLTNSNNSSGGIAISAGTLEINTTGSVNALGSGTLTMGNPANTGAAAAIQFNGNSSNFPAFANAINVTGNGADLIYATSWNPIFSGPVTLSNNLTIGSNNHNGSTLTFNGGVSGTGNITVSIDNSEVASYVTFGAAAVNNSGTLTFNNTSFNGGPVGTGNGTNTISGGVGSNVTAITQGSNVNALTISTNPLSVNDGGTTLISSGSALFTVSGGVNGTGNLVLQNNTATTNAITLSTSAVNNAGTITNSGSGSGGVTIGAPILANVTGIVESSASSPLTLSGANSFTGSVTISAGTLQVGTGGSGASIGAVSGVLDNGSLVFNHSDTVTFSPPISGSGSVTQMGNSLLILTGGNSYSGGTTVAGGTLQIGNGGSGTAIGNTSGVLDNGSLAFNHGDTLNFSPSISGSGSLTRRGSGSLTLLGNNAYSDATTVSGGVLGLTGTLSGSSITVNAATAAFNEGPGGLIAGGGSFNVTAGSATLAGANVFTGIANLNVASGAGGTLVVQNAAALGAGSVQVYNNTGGTASLLLESPTGMTIANSFQTTGYGGGSGNVAEPGLIQNISGSNTLSGVISLTSGGGGTALKVYGGSLTLSGTVQITASSRSLLLGGPGTGFVTGTIVDGNATLSVDKEDSGTWTLSGTGNAFSGTVTVGNGTLVLGSASTYTGATTISGGTLQIGTGGSGELLTSSSISDNGTLAFNHSDALIYPGSITGTGNLVKQGSGTLTLTAASNFSGGTTILGGTLKLAGAVSGFGGSGLGWTITSSGISSTPVTNNVLTLTDNNLGEARSAFYNTPVSAGSFTASFIYQTAGNKQADGVALVLQNDPRGASALGGSGQNLGYSGIIPSAAFELNIQGAYGRGPAFNTNGANGGYNTTTGVNLASGDAIQVLLNYDGSSNLTAQLTDLVTKATWSNTYTGVNLGNIVSGNSVYVGFTGADGGLDSTQTIRDFYFSNASTTGSNILPATAGVSIGSGAILDMSGVSQTISSLADTTPGATVGSQILLAGGSLTVGNSSSTTFSGSISGAGGSLTKVGLGRITLSGSGTFTGPTTINQGMLLVNGPLVSPVTVNSGGTVGGTGFLGSVTVAPSGAIAPGNPLGTLAMSGSLVLAAGAAMDYELDTPTTSDLISCSSLTLNGQQFTDFNVTFTGSFGPGAYDLIASGVPISGSLGASTSGTVDGYAANLAVQGDNLVLTVVPEPGTLALLAAGALVLLGCGLRRRRAARRTAKPTALDQRDAPRILAFPSLSSPANVARRAA